MRGPPERPDRGNGILGNDNAVARWTLAGNAAARHNSGMTDVTRLLNAIAAGNPAAAGDLLPRVYDELRRLAAAKLAHERPGQTLDATALVHEAYLRLVGPDGALHFANRGHFFAAAAEAMRRVLVENARRKACAKHGGGRRRIDLDAVVAPATSGDDLLALDVGKAQRHTGAL